MPHICPLLNPYLFSATCDRSFQKLKFLSEYFLYLGFKRVAVEFDISHAEEITNLISKVDFSLTQVVSVLQGSRIGVVLIVSIRECSVQEGNELWKSFIKCRRTLEQEMSLECFIDFKCAVNDKMALDRWLG